MLSEDSSRWVTHNLMEARFAKNCVDREESRSLAFPPCPAQIARRRWFARYLRLFSETWGVRLEHVGSSNPGHQIPRLVCLSFGGGHEAICCRRCGYTLGLRAGMPHFPA